MEKEKDTIYESGEDYLETILRLQKRQGQVRSIDIANELDYSKPSISRAMKILQEKGYVHMDNKKLIHLTDSGLEIAERVYKRHLLIKQSLEIFLGLPSDLAEKDACRIEHIVSQETIDKLQERMEKHLHASN